MIFNKKNKILIIFSIAIFLAQLFFVHQALAQGGGGTGGGGGGTGGFELANPLRAESFEALVTDIASWLVAIAIPFATIMILYAAVLFMTSGGNEERVKKAKRALTWAIVGIAIIIIGAGFVTLIKDILEVQ